MLITLYIIGVVINYGRLRAVHNTLDIIDFIYIAYSWLFTPIIIIQYFTRKERRFFKWK